MPFNFIVAGNIVDEDGGYGIFERLFVSSLKYKPELLVVIGSFVKEPTKAGYDKAFEFLKSLHTKFGLPVEVIPGAGESGGGKLPEWFQFYFGEPTASFTHGGMRFVCLDTSGGVLDSNQLSFLDRQLTQPSFVFSYCPPAVGLWKTEGALKDGSEPFIQSVSSKSTVRGCFFSSIRATGREELLDGGMVVPVPAYLVGNSGGKSFVLSKFGYSKPAPNSIMLVKVGQAVEFEVLE